MDRKIRERIADVIKSRRESRGESQYDVAESLRTKQATMSKYENARILPTLPRLAEFAEHWGVRLAVGFEQGSPGSVRVFDEEPPDTSDRLLEIADELMTLADEVEDEHVTSIYRCVRAIRSATK